MAQQMTLPELGENIDTAQVVAVLVSVGDTVKKDQSVLEVETDKATAEVPSPFAGTVEKIAVEAGDEVQVGQVVLYIKATTDAPSAEAPAPAEDGPAAPAIEPLPAEPAPTPVAAPAPAPAPSQEAQPAIRIAASNDAPAPAPASTGASQIPAAPSVRRWARELGVELSRVQGSGPGGRISIEDVKRHVRAILSRQDEIEPPPPPAIGGFASPELPDFSKWGPVDREGMTKVRRLTAEKMSISWNVIPHVTQFDQADITELEDLRRRYAKKAEAVGGKLTVTAVVFRMVASALRAFPKFNCSIDDRNHEIVYKRYVHIGCAVDTDRGLLVPVIRNVDQKNILQIAAELNELAGKARNRKISVDELRGGTFSITNLGGLGTTNFDPIVNWPEVAVLGLGRAQTEAVWLDDRFVPRKILPLSLSYDHRIIDGADAARFLRWIAEALEQPLLLALEG